MKTTTNHLPIKRKSFLWAIVSFLICISIIISGLALNPGLRVNAQGGENRVLLPLVSREASAYPSLFGMQMNKITINEGLNEVRNAKVYWIRREIHWQTVEPTEGVRNWVGLASFEQELIEARNSGMEPLIIIGDTPLWAVKSGFPCGVIADDKLGAFESVVFDIVSRYSQPPYNVRYWEIYNEPDAYGTLGCWGDPNDHDYFGGGYYGQMVMRVYPKFKQADPDAQVLIGGLLLDCDPINPPDDPNNPGTKRDCSPSKFLEGAILQGAGPYFDGVAFHTYDFNRKTLGEFGNSNWHSAWDTTGPVIFAKVSYLQNLLNSYGLTDKYLMNTEVALLCDTCGTNDPTFETTKAYYIAKYYASAIADGMISSVWYSLKGWRNSGIINDDLTPKPGYYAFVFSQKELWNAQYLAPVTSQQVGGASAVFGYRFNRPEGELWVIWAMDTNNHQVTLSGTPSAVFDTMGNPYSFNGQQVNVNKQPIYIEW